MGFDQYPGQPEDFPPATRTFARLWAWLTGGAKATGG